MGKSHLITFASVLLLQSKPNAHVYIIYSTENLMKKDAELIEQVRSITRCGARLKVYVAKHTLRPREVDFVLIDEFDEVYFSNLSWFE